jgi:uncharacterized protein (DUF58 family)
MTGSLRETLARAVPRRAPSPPPPAAATLFDEALLGRLRQMSLLSGQIRTEGIVGEHRSRRRGSSPEFADFKSYSQGDDFRRIDWNTYARLGGLFVRLSEVTTELGVHVLLDASDSMDWRGDPNAPTKFDYGRRLAGALGYLALWHFDRLMVTPFGDALGHGFGPAQGRSHAVPMLRTLERMAPLGGTALVDAVDRYLHARRRPGVLLLITDLLAGEPDDLRASLRDARARGWQVALLHVLDEAEVAPAFAGAYLGAGADQPGGAVELIEAETGRRLLLSPTDGLLERYGEAVAAWLDGAEAVCVDEGAIYVRLLTSWPLDEVVLRTLREAGVVG